MITAELIHNPYLLKTEVFFNGSKPKVNSQIEKYLSLPLQDWVSELPSIFYNEMNGYDFDFNFSGTESDFAEIEKSFLKRGVSNEQVRLFHKNVLEGITEKRERLADLLAWFNANRNRRFDLDAFLVDSADVLSDSFPVVLIRGSLLGKRSSYMGVEVVESAEELKNTDLTSTPIVIDVTEDTRAAARKDIALLLGRKDVRRRQLFFSIHSDVNRAQVLRTISDLGVKVPQVITSFDDELLMRFMEDYPLTENIREICSLLGSTAYGLQILVDEDKNSSEVENRTVYQGIERLEGEIGSLESCCELYQQIDSWRQPDEFRAARVQLSESIFRWRNRRTKIEGDEEIEIAAGEYEYYLRGKLRDFLFLVNKSFQSEVHKINSEMKRIFSTQQVDLGFYASNVIAPQMNLLDELHIKDELVAQKQVSFVDPDPGIMIVFLKNDDQSLELVRVATCFYEQWRTAASEKISAMVDALFEECDIALREYRDSLIATYVDRLESVIKAKTLEKNKASSQLSEDERMLQEDIDWLATLKGKLAQIERD